jgi:hypothetical protein
MAGGLRGIVNRILRRGRRAAELDEDSIRSQLQAAFADVAMPQALADRIRRGMLAETVDVGEAVREAHPVAAMPAELRSRVVHGMVSRMPQAQRRPARIRLVTQYAAAMALVAVCLGLTVHFAALRFGGTNSDQSTVAAPAPTPAAATAPKAEQHTRAALKQQASGAEQEQSRRFGYGAPAAEPAPSGPSLLVPPHGAAADEEEMRAKSRRPTERHSPDTSGLAAVTEARVTYGAAGVERAGIAGAGKPPKDTSAKLGDVALGGVAVVSGAVDRGGTDLANDLELGQVPETLDYLGTTFRSYAARCGLGVSAPGGRVAVVAFEPSSGTGGSGPAPPVSRFYAEVTDADNNTVTLSTAKEGDSVSIHTARYQWDKSGVWLVARAAGAGGTTAPASTQDKGERRKKSNGSAE